MRVLFSQISRGHCIHCSCESNISGTKVKVGAEEYWNYKCLECGKDPYFKGEE